MRRHRIEVPGVPMHVVQRGVDRSRVFRDDDDRQHYLVDLDTCARAAAVGLHGYVLMDNHFHLLVTPTTQDGLPRMMQAVGRRYVQYFNRRHARTGTLWEGRYRSMVLQPERYLLPCMVYLDLNPVRAGLVQQAADYAWSSHAHWVGLRNDRWLAPHALYWALGNTPFAREAAYAALVQAGLGAAMQTSLTDSALSGWALGDAEFLEGLQQQTPRRVTRGAPGRPRSIKNIAKEG